MDGRELKEVWRSGTKSYGAGLTLVDAAVAAMMCNMGWEWILIDAEHQPYNIETLRDILEVILRRNVVPIVRVRANDPSLIKQMLDFGAEGVMVPMLRTPEEARLAASACRYPPQGIRGFSPREASNYFKDLDHYLATIDDRVIAMLQVEHIDAVNCIDEFLRTPGLDCILIGPADLSFSMGLPMQIRHPKVQAAIQTVIERCNAAGVPVGAWIGETVEEKASYMARGLNFLIAGADVEWLLQGGEATLRGLRAATGGR